MYIQAQINYLQEIEHTHEFDIVKIYNIKDIVIDLWNLKIAKQTKKLIGYLNMKIFILNHKPLLNNIILIPTKYEKDIVFIDKFPFSIEQEYLFLRDIKLLKDFIDYILNKTNITIICFDGENIKLYVLMNDKKLLEIIILENKSIKVKITNVIEDFNIMLDLVTIIKIQLENSKIILQKIINKKLHKSLYVD